MLGKHMVPWSRHQNSGEHQVSLERLRASASRSGTEKASHQVHGCDGSLVTMGRVSALSGQGLVCWANTRCPGLGTRTLGTSISSEEAGGISIQAVQHYRYHCHGGGFLVTMVGEMDLGAGDKILRSQCLMVGATNFLESEG